MGEAILSIEGVGKKYLLQRRTEGPRGLRHVLTDVLKRPFTRGHSVPSAGLAAGTEEFWALRDIRFDVRPGEVVGIIGRNGAGKSTLLKILSRITVPTTGRITLRGRIASLLEVGTGFHPELTGRENIYLNGAILGMTRVEIKKRFDAIVAFSEVERFLDTPVKRYSSGMYMRLAFAVAAHLEPEILVVDEVLAVGDGQFQQKCLGKMGEVASQQGRTILFVSHNLAAVQKLCGECKLIEEGRLVCEGRPAEVVREYLDLAGRNLAAGAALCQQESCEVRLRVLDRDARPTRTWRYGESLRFDVTVVAHHPIWNPAVDLAFYDDRRTRLFALQSDRLGTGPERIEGSWTASFVIENPGLALSEVSLDVGVREGSGEYLALIRDAGRLSVDSSAVSDLALSDCLLHPRSAHEWQAGEAA